MSSGRRSARRQAVFVLYQQDLLRLTASEALGRINDEAIDDFARRLVEGYAACREPIDRAVADRLSGWSLERLGALERSILRMGAYELLYEKDTPAAVAIDEAVGLAKRFCSPEAGALVNGVLGSLLDDEGRGPESSSVSTEETP